jgi:aquaporin related protein
MPGEPSELPLHYGGKTADGELVKRPTSPIVPASPLRSYYQSAHIGYSPERVLNDHQPYPATEPENIRGNTGLRRRPSNHPPSARSQSMGAYDRERPSFSESDSRRGLRSRDDGYYRDDERTTFRRDDYHPDSFERSRPPRSYRNIEAWERVPGSASKPYFEETKIDRDPERGDWSNMERKRVSDEESVDGYNYDAHKFNKNTIDFRNLTPEERAEVMRLPWTQWMNSDVKNRMYPLTARASGLDSANI